MSTKFKSTLATLSTLNTLKSLGCSWMLSEQPGTNMVFPDATSTLRQEGRDITQCRATPAGDMSCRQNV